jgi:hypothetical protein
MKSRERPIPPETLSFHRQSEPEQLETDRPGWRPRRLGYGGRQWSRRPMSDLGNRLRVESYKQQQPFASTVMDLGRDGKTPPEYLTENGLKLLKVLALGAREMDELSRYAEEDEFDLVAALDELRRHSLVGEGDSNLIGLLGRKVW